MEIGRIGQVNGNLVSSSWCSCLERERDDEPPIHSPFYSMQQFFEPLNFVHVLIIVHAIIFVLQVGVKVNFVNKRSSCSSSSTVKSSEFSSGVGKCQQQQLLCEQVLKAVEEMATLPQALQEFLDSLPPEEQRKYWTNHYEDTKTKNVCLRAGLAWNPKTEGSAIKYLLNLKRRKELATQQELKEQEPEGKLLNIPGEGSKPNSPPPTDTTNKMTLNIRGGSSDNNLDGNLSDNESLASGSIATDHDCRSVASSCSRRSRVSGHSNASCSGVPTPGIIKKYPGEAFQKITEVTEGGLFNKVAIGTVHGQWVKVKTLHRFAPPDGKSGGDDEKAQLFKKIFQLQHRNLIPMIGTIDVGLNENPKVVYTYKRNEVSLLQYLRSNSNVSEELKGNFTRDIMSGCEYLHSHGIPHGLLAASSIVIRTIAIAGGGGGRKQKLHMNAFLTDGGIGVLTDRLAANNGDFYKVQNGKYVHLRWSPKEVLLAGYNSKMHSFSADIWSIGVVLWEMWTDGGVPYGKRKPNLEVERDILDNCSPLTHLKPTCPRHVMDTMNLIFTPAIERPTISTLKQKFEDFRKYEYNKNGDSLMNGKYQNDKKIPSLAAVVSSTKSSSSSGYSYSRGSRPSGSGRNRLGSGSSSSGLLGKRSTPVQSFKDLSNNCGGRNRRRSESNNNKSSSGSVNKNAVMFVPVSMVPSTSRGGEGEGRRRDRDRGQISQIRDQVNSLAKTVATLSVVTAARQAVVPNLGTNSVNVNFESQRFSREDVNGPPDCRVPSGGGGKNENTSILYCSLTFCGVLLISTLLFAVNFMYTNAKE